MRMRKLPVILKMAADQNSNPMTLQLQMKQNALEMQDCLKDLADWETDIKKKEEYLVKQKPILKKAVPPIRGKIQKGDTGTSPLKIKQKKELQGGSKRIKSFDYRAWDKFVVDEACASGSEEEECDLSSEEGTQNSEDEFSREEQQKKQKALLEKEKGNDLFKEGKHEAAIEHYTKGLQLDPSNAVLAANRAMALIKTKRFAAAEVDCTAAIKIDDTYTKAYFRRATTRALLDRHEEAVQDFEKVLELEPTNKQARTDLDKLKKKLADLKKKSKSVPKVKQSLPPPFVSPVHRAPQLRSSKPLRRVTIDEFDEDMRRSSLTKEEVTIRTNETASANGAKEQSAERLVKELPPTEATTTDKEGKPLTDPKTMDQVHTTKEHNDQANVVVTTSKNPFRGDLEASPKASKSLEEENPFRGDMEASPKASKSLEEENPFRGDLEASPKASKSLEEENPFRGDMEASPKASKSLEEDKSLPPVPATSFQFISDWRGLRKDRARLLSYLKAIPPPAYPSVLRQSLETDTFGEILSLLNEYYTKEGKSCLDELTWITKVKRFSVTVMFLSKKDRIVLKEMFLTLNELHKDELSVVENLYKLYGL